MATTSERNLSYDFLRLVASFLVVHVHVLSFVIGPPYGFDYYLGWYAVPIFVTITFLLNAKIFAPDVPLSALSHKLSRFFIPFVFWSTIGFVLHPELAQLKYLARQILTGTAVNAPLYYLLVVSIITSVLWLIVKIARAYAKWVFGVLLIALVGRELIGMQLVVPAQVQFFTDRLLELTKYALATLLLAQHPAYISITKRVSRWLLLFVPVGIFAKMGEQQTGTYAGIIPLGVVVGNIAKIGEWDIPRWVTTMSRYTLGVYCLHFLFVERLHNVKLPAIILSICIFSFCWTISWLIDRITNGKLARVVA